MRLLIAALLLAISYAQTEYSLHCDVSLNFWDAIEYCASLGKEIASFHSDEDWAQATDEKGRIACNAYIGGLSDDEGTWSYVDGSDWWQPENANMPGTKEIVAVAVPKGEWVDWGRGQSEMGVICQTPYKRYSVHCEIKRNYVDSAAFCPTVGKQVAIFRSQEEFNMVLNEKGRIECTAYAAGVKAVGSEVWYWNDGTLMNYIPGLTDGMDHYDTTNMAVTPDSKWQDWGQGTELLGVICMYPQDCAGVPYGTTVEDVCGVCGGDDSSCADCKGVTRGTAVEDECGVCDGDNSSCTDCEGVPNGSSVEDECGVCGGDNSSCSDCAGVPNGSSVEDDCGVCGGDGSSCKYTVYCSERNFDDGNKYCQSIGMQMATFANEAEWLSAVDESGSMPCIAYAGGILPAEGEQWKWLDGTEWWQPKTNTNLGNSKYFEDRLAIRTNGKWVDWGQGTDELGVVCMSPRNGAETLLNSKELTFSSQLSKYHAITLSLALIGSLAILHTVAFFMYNKACKGDFILVQHMEI